MLAALNPFHISLLYLIGGAVVSYAGMWLLWDGASRGRSPVRRGAIMAMPVIAIALMFAFLDFGWLALALLCSASVLLLTLGLGVSAASAPAMSTDGEVEGIATPTLRLLAPLAACTFLIGTHGELSLSHALAMAVIAGLVWWSMPTPVMSSAIATEQAAAVRSGRAMRLLIGGAVMLGAALLVTQGARVFLAHVSIVAVTPIIVLLVAPAMLLAMLGLLAGEANRGNATRAADTVAGFVVTCLSAQAVVIGFAHAMRFGRNLAGDNADTETINGQSWTFVTNAAAATQATTQPAADAAAIVMPIATWRVDAVLLLVLSLLLLPVGTGRLRLAKIEGLALLALFILYAAVATRAGAR